MAMKLDERRRFLNLSQGAVAEKLGVSVNTIANWEKRPETVPVGKVIEMVRLYNCEFNDLIFVQTDGTN